MVNEYQSNQRENITYWAHRVVSRGLDLQVGGIILTLIGFVMPWFKFDDDYGWSYSGWEYLTDEYNRSGWAFVVVALFVILFVLTFRKYGYGARTVVGLAALMSLGAFVALAAASMEDPFDTIQLGIPVMIAGSAILLWGLLSNAVAGIIRDVV